MKYADTLMMILATVWIVITMFTVLGIKEQNEYIISALQDHAEQGYECEVIEE